MARTFDDIYDKLDELINAFSRGSGSILGSGSTIGHPYYRGYKDIIDDDVESLDDLIKKYEELENTELDHYERVEQAEQEAKEFLENHRDELEEIIDLKKNGIELDEKQIKLYHKAHKAAQQLNESRRTLSQNTKFSAYINGVENKLNRVTGLVSSMYNEVKKLTDPWAKADHAASKYAKTIGQTKKGMDELRHNALTASTKNNIGSWFNMTTDELIQAQTDYTQKVGRSIRMSSEDLTNMAAMKAVMGERGNELATLYENFGVSMSSTAKSAGKMFAEASKAGISFEKYSDNVSKNIKIAQNYTFKNGLKGLESMAKKATAIRLDMQQVAALAEKVNTVEGAIDVSAKLQVLGGPFAQMSDPLGMLNESLTDMEGLQDRLVKMISGMGQFDKTTGEVKVSAFNKTRIKAAADAMGVSYDNIMESINAQARRNEIGNQITSSTSASRLNDDMKELLKNVGTFKDGKAGVSINGEFKSIDQLKNSDYEQLLIETRSESEDIKDIAKNVRSLVDAREGLGKQWNNIKARMFSWLGLTEKGIAKGLGSNIFKPVLYGAIGLTGIWGGAKLFAKGQLLFKAIKSLFKSIGNIGRVFSSRAGGTANAIGGSNGSIISRMFRGGSRRGSASVGTSVGANISDDIARTTIVNSADDAARIAGRRASTGFLANKITTKSGAHIIKGTAGQTMKRAAIATIGKSGVQTIGKIGAQVGTNLAASSWAGPLGLIGGIASAAGDIAIDRAVAKGKMKKGGVGHHFAKAGTGALGGAAMGASIGMFLGPVGAAVGAVIGAVGGAITGLVKAGKAKQERILDEKLSEMGIQRKGDYNRAKLKKINKALERGDGKVSERVRRKLKKEGDYELLDKLDAQQIERNKKELALIESKNKLKEAKRGKKGIAKKRIASANIIVNNATFSGRGLNGLGGFKIGFNNPLGAFTRMRLRAKEEFEQGKVTFKAIKEKGINGSWEAIKESNGNKKEVVNNNKKQEYNININGTLKLTGDNGQSIDIINEIRNNQTLLDEITRLIAKNIERLEGGVSVGGF